MIETPERIARTSKGPTSRWALLPMAFWLLSCGLGLPESESRTSGPPVALELRDVPSAVLESNPGIFIQKGDATDLEFMEWQSESTANDAIQSLPAGTGGTIYFAPGRYVVRHGIVIKDIDDVALVAAPGVELVFPARGPQTIQLAAPATEGQEQLTVDRSEELSLGGRYQLFPPSGKGGRLLEFTVQELQGKRVGITRPVKLMKHVKSIPQGSIVIEELNFIRVFSSHNVWIQGFAMDGLNRGEVRGHTIFSGIIVANRYHEARAAGAPLFAGLHIVGNRCHNLRGRGMAIYGTRDVIVDDNHFDNIGAQAIEIDHFSSARVTRNVIRNAGVGIQLDDVFETIVKENVIETTRKAIVSRGHFQDSWANTGNKIIQNSIIGPGEVGIHLSKLAHGNLIADNDFTAIEKPFAGSIEDNAIGENLIR